ncbi:MAG: hypothetical protein EA382_04725 [Spirochaetaceae bacterium]|nr:MAG: hypothetical protein EA382_04725 [Spirochaetaceae bacterium]
MSVEPEYVRFEPKERDELLSQVGSFTPVERTLFERLCAVWQPRIDTERFMKRSASPEQERSALDRLMAKLRGAQLGLIVPADEAASQPGFIILTSAGSLDFWRELVGMEVGRCLRAGHLPSEQRLTDRNALPPGYHVKDISSTELAAAYTTETDGELIYRIRLLDDVRIVFPAWSAKGLITSTLNTIRVDTDERGITEEIARVRNSSIHETREQLKSRAPDAWLAISQTIVKERKTIAFRKNIDDRDEIFQMAYLMMIFVEAQLGAAKRRIESDEHIDAELETIVAAVATTKDGLMPQDQFELLVDQATARLGTEGVRLTSRLKERVLTPRPRRALATVLYLHGGYLHCDSVIRVFNPARVSARDRLVREYVDLIEAYLRGRQTDISEVLGSRDQFNEDLRIRVERAHPLLGEIIARPQVLAEAVIRDAKQRNPASTPDELKAALERYFNVDSSQLRPIADLLELNVVELFDSAYHRLSVLRQLLMRLSGRHESLRNSYERRFGPRRAGSRSPSSAPTEAGGPIGSTAGAERNDARELAGTRVRGTGKRSSPAEQSRRAGRAPSAPQKPRPKSAKEIEAVWQEFGNALHSKPKSE